MPMPMHTTLCYELTPAPRIHLPSSTPLEAGFVDPMTPQLQPRVENPEAEAALPTLLDDAQRPAPHTDAVSSPNRVSSVPQMRESKPREGRERDVESDVTERERDIEQNVEDGERDRERETSRRRRRLAACGVQAEEVGGGRRKGRGGGGGIREPESSRGGVEERVIPLSLVLRCLPLPLSQSPSPPLPSPFCLFSSSSFSFPPSIPSFSPAVSPSRPPNLPPFHGPDRETEVEKAQVWDPCHLGEVRCEWGVRAAHECDGVLRRSRVAVTRPAS
ncbi:hypothetical protein B0H13DRAFT_2348929 [Mycena leptocephala]|nr:hypothetical protein B0H13DRAFT_2348929 [Mycena leptocephala]